MGLDMTFYEIPPGSSFEEYEKELGEYLDSHTWWPENFVSSGGAREIFYFRRHYGLDNWLTWAGMPSKSESGYTEMEITAEIVERLERELEDIMSDHFRSHYWDESEELRWLSAYDLPCVLHQSLQKGNKIIYTASW